MFSLAMMKRKKLQQRADVINLLQKFPKRNRPIFPLVCDSSINIIAEVKKASPSAGTIKDVDPATQATLYQKAGAKAVSVLADSYYFNGSFDDVYHVADAVRLPVLCKEFICYPEQIDVAYSAGADMILLIASLLSSDELHYLFTYTTSKGLLPLIEVHTISELDSVLTLQPDYIMVNIRNLNTLELEYDIAIATLKSIPDNIQTICASGINNPETLQRIKEQTGTTTFLVGTALMKANDPQKLLQELSHVC
ncbi:MAG TPA: indole-3-glycerol-phosphate synthase [Spirochaetota bacterium]|nr:indole-3-glycerol-phosphate synthase [Spirochaetota bacterium]